MFLYILINEQLWKCSASHSQAGLVNCRCTYVCTYTVCMYVCMLVLLQVLQKPDKMTAILVRFLPNGQVRIYIHVHAWYGVLDPMQHKACGVLAPYVVGWSDMADYSKCVCEHTLVSL